MSRKSTWKKRNFSLLLVFLLLTLAYNNCSQSGFKVSDFKSVTESSQASNSPPPAEPAPMPNPAEPEPQNPQPAPQPQPAPNPMPQPNPQPQPMPQPNPVPANDRFACGGKVETEAWAMWDGNTYMRQFVLADRDRVVKQKDVYGLYDIQIHTQNLWSMAARCGRTSRLREVAKLIQSLYAVLEPSPSGIGRAWICRGGDICPEAGLMGQEVKLTTFQFLGLASFVANALATSNANLTAEDKTFINDTALILAEHFVRWSDSYQMSVLQSIIDTPLSKITAGNEVLFSDQELWQITSYAELSGIRQWQKQQGIAENSFVTKNESRMRNHLNLLMQAFKSRTSLFSSGASRIANVEQADLDRGFWRLMDGNQYAGYEGATKPVICSPTAQVVVPKPAPREGIGWDFSHARRLIQAMDALERNREKMKSSFALTEAQLPSANLPKAFAANLINSVWNGNLTSPLFTNYTNGANGWFLAYSINGACDEGMKPFSMSDTFPTGGFITWAQYYPVIGDLGARMYELVSTPTGYQSSFMTKNYPRLSGPPADGNRAISTFMFLPTLVGVPGLIGK